VKNGEQAAKLNRAL